MKSSWKVLLAALPLLLISGQVNAGDCGPYTVGGSFRLSFSCGNGGYSCGNGGGGCGCTAGPWYSYWPYEAHFQAPAPTGCFPYWPSPDAAAGLPAGGVVPPVAVSQPGTYQPVGYQAPNYWYGR
jgi:hypothetical protein